MKEKLDDLIRNISIAKNIHHTYLIYLKLNSEKNSEIARELLIEKNINNKIWEIYKSNVKNAKVVKRNDHGEVFDYKIIEIKYKSYKLIYIESISNLVFVNYFEENEKYPENQDVCYYNIISELKKKCGYSFKYEGHTYNAINTHEPFLDFCHSFKKVIHVDENSSFWQDFNAYIKSEPLRGRYNYFQIGDLFVVTGFEEIKEVSVLDRLTTKINVPTINY